MGWVFFQVFLAFGMGVLIVWWTWPKNRDPRRDKDVDQPAEPAAGDKK